MEKWVRDFTWWVDNDPSQGKANVMACLWSIYSTLKIAYGICGLGNSFKRISMSNIY